MKWKPFFLNRSTPSEGYDLKEYLRAKYGAPAIARFESPDNPLDRAGQNVGITFNKTRRIVNTLDGHRLMEWCNERFPDQADTLMESFFHAYFEEARDLSIRENLIRCAIEAGLDEMKAKEILDTGAYKDEVLQFDQETKTQSRVNGVPYFIIRNSSQMSKPVTFSGAQSADIISEVLSEVSGNI